MLYRIRKISNNENLRKTLFLAILFILTLSCRGPKNFTRNFDRKYGLTHKSSSYTYVDSCFILKTDGLRFFEAAGHAKKIKSVFIPAIFYWREDYKVLCNLNPSVPVDILCQELNVLAKQNKLKNQLKGRHIELSVDKIPTLFTYEQKSTIIMFCLDGTLENSVTGIFPQDDFLEISYKVLEKDKFIDGGIIRIFNAEESFLYRNSKSTDDFIRNYLYEYEKNIKILSKEFYKRLTDEIML